MAALGLIVLLLAIVLLIIIVSALYIELKEWNYGTCKESGHPWISFTVDSSGAVGYKDDHGHFIWISPQVTALASKLERFRS